MPQTQHHLEGWKMTFPTHQAGTSLSLTCFKREHKQTHTNPKSHYFFPPPHPWEAPVPGGAHASPGSAQPVE